MYHTPIEGVLDALEYEFIELVSHLNIRDNNLETFSYETIAVEETRIRKKTKKGEREYVYIQLKGYNTVYIQLKGYNTKTHTIETYTPETAPTEELNRLVKLYRAIRHLRRALDYLYAL